MAAQVRGSQAKRWCFTINNYCDDWKDSFRDFFCDENISFGIAATEVGANGTKHLQCFVHLKKKKHLVELKRDFNEIFGRAHMEIARGNDEQNKDYCSKDRDMEDHEYMEFGTITMAGTSDKGGGYNAEYVSKILEWRINDETSPADLLLDQNYGPMYAKHYKLIESVVLTERVRQNKADILDSHYVQVNFRQWQTEILTVLEGEPDPQKVYWVWDTKGNQGKT